MAAILCRLIAHLKIFWKYKVFLQRKEKGVFDFFLIKIWDICLQLNGNSWIGYASDIPYQPCFPYGINSIFISSGAKIGKNAVIFQQVTIGSNTIDAPNNSEDVGSPTIGENVYIGAGAKIIGKVKIGNNCRIGANAIVYFDMPDHSVATAASTRLIQKENLDNRFYRKQNGRWRYYDNGLWKELTNLKPET